eukprot:scaffold104073_cov34-Prasinocladus_malaysianus.AAC.1
MESTPLPTGALKHRCNICVPCSFLSGFPSNMCQCQRAKVSCKESFGGYFHAAFCPCIHHLWHIGTICGWHTARLHLLAKTISQSVIRYTHPVMDDGPHVKCGIPGKIIIVIGTTIFLEIHFYFLDDIAVCHPVRFPAWALHEVLRMLDIFNSRLAKTEHYFWPWPVILLRCSMKA